ncbi:hypothetical protein [Komagataeibacter diospyri]|uniref:hypothetical protein n=1 Tax=Komagataeibacter diospyri TaxID=1932662 RepID=UPI001143BAB2|nr:hypothetical protein [Komagataeibacter diospyri]
MTYASRKEDAVMRLYQKRRKLIQKLGGAGTQGAMEHIPAKPKGMWQQTYCKIREAIYLIDYDLADLLDNQQATFQTSLWRKLSIMRGWI